ncbi:hypothetical protein [Pluralibacter gergoviae]|uniref:hypothetical protein n=1 Tax=Pluralibacter gergoviae TaxID=61647 RepID=UPI00388E6AD6
MSVPNQTPYNIYTANGLTTVFAYEFYLISAGDIQVTINGAVVIGGYSVGGVGNVGGGDITFLTPPANGSMVVLERNIPTYRLTDYQDNGDLLADTVNKDFDRLWMAIQRAFIYLGLALTRPLLGGPFNAKGYRIENLGDPVNAGDAANKKFVIEHGASNLQRTLRVPEQSVNQLYPVTGRRNSLLGFDSNGNPVPIFAMTNTADLAIKLASHDQGLGAALVGVEKYGTVADAIKYVTPPMLGIIPGDQVTNNVSQWNVLFNLGIPVVIPAGKWYCNGGEITIPDKSFALGGYGEGVSKLIFTTAGCGIRQTVSTVSDTFAPQFYIRGVSILTALSVSDNSNKYGFYYDCTEYLNSLEIRSNGYKYVGARTINRGKIEACTFGAKNPETAYGWESAINLYGAIGVQIVNSTLNLSNGLTGHGIWIHGDGMISGFDIIGCHSFFGNYALYCNDYMEGLNVDTCTLINNKYAYYGYPDDKTSVKSLVIHNTPTFNNCHFLSYIKNIYANWHASSRITGGEYYIYPASSVSPVSQGIDIITCDGVHIENVNIVLATDVITSAIGIQLHAGKQIQVHNINFKGSFPYSYCMQLGTSAAFYACQISNTTIRKADFGIYANYSNAYGLDIEVPNLLVPDDVTTPISTADNVLARTNYKFKRHTFYATHTYTTTGSTITIDISASKFKGRPLFVIANPRAGAYGGQQYHYRSDASSNTSVVIQVIHVDGYTPDTTTVRTVYFDIVGY